MILSAALVSGYAAILGSASGRAPSTREIVLSAAFVAGYLALLGFVAVRARAAREYADFSLARRSLPLALIFGSLCAAYVGPGFSYGFVAMGFKSGVLFLCVGLAYAVQNILVGLFIAPRLRSLSGCHTLGDAIGLKYNRNCQVIAGIISVGLCAGFAAVMVSALVDVVTGLFHIPAWVVAALAVVATTLYTAFGGLKASVMTDALQFTLFSILMPAVFLYELIWCLQNSAVTFTHELVTATSEGFHSTPVVEIVGFVVAWLLGETAIPPYANRALATQTTQSSRNSFILGGLFSVLWFTIMISLGVVGMGVSIAFLLLAAPDLAIVQVAVEVVSVIFLIRATIGREISPTREHIRWPALALGGVVLAAFLALGFLATRELGVFGEPVMTRVSSAPSNRYLAQGIRETGSANLVTSIVLDYRGYDTLGEATVLFAAVVGTLVILRGKARKGGR